MNDTGTAVTEKVRRAAIIAELKQREGRCYFGGVYPGSAELDQGAHDEAVENTQRMYVLTKELAQINKPLGLSPESRDTLE